MTVNEVLSQITVKNHKVISKTTGKEYEYKDFIDQIVDKCKFNQKQRKELETYFSDYIQPQTEDSKFIEELIDKYEFKFSDGIYIIKGKVISIDNIYRLMWREEKLLPSKTLTILNDIERICEPLPLQKDIFNLIEQKAIKGKSRYIDSLYKYHENTNWISLFHNILVPKTKQYFHILYDNGTGGTGKSTLLKVIMDIISKSLTSNILLDQFSNRFIFANMMGKYANIGDDTGETGEIQNIGILKSIITGERVTIDRKNINPIEVNIFAKQLFATNLFPYIDFTDGGIMRRLNVVPMNNKIPDNAKLPEFTKEEIGAIVYQAINGKDLETNNNEQAITQHPLYRFYNDKKYKKDYDSYKGFCIDCGFRQMNINNFELKMRFLNHYNPKQSKLEEITKEEEGDLGF